jgi:hypothetical protein
MRVGRLLAVEEAAACFGVVQIESFHGVSRTGRVEHKRRSVAPLVVPPFLLACFQSGDLEPHPAFIFEARPLGRVNSIPRQSIVQL